MERAATHRRHGHTFSESVNSRADDVQGAAIIKYIVDGCSKGLARFTSNGKNDRAMRILIKANVDLSHIQPTLTDEQKKQFSVAMSMYVGGVFLFDCGY